MWYEHITTQLVSARREGRNRLREFHQCSLGFVIWIWRWGDLFHALVKGKRERDAATVHPADQFESGPCFAGWIGGDFRVGAGVGPLGTSGRPALLRRPALCRGRSRPRR